MKSHPSWVCGLKLSERSELKAGGGSHPSWVCGLKHATSSSSMKLTRLSHPSWVCGLKQNNCQGVYQ